MRQRFCKACGGWHELDAWPYECLPEHTSAQSDLACPNIIGDSMPTVQSQATGMHYDSKSAIRAEYKRLGMVEIGNDPARLRPRARPKANKAEIKTVLDVAEARFNRGERAFGKKL